MYKYTTLPSRRREVAGMPAFPAAAGKQSQVGRHRCGRNGSFVRTYIIWQGGCLSLARVSPRTEGCLKPAVICDNDSILDRDWDIGCWSRANAEAWPRPSVGG